jgi:hypothetical protein
MLEQVHDRLWQRARTAANFLLTALWDGQHHLNPRLAPGSSA